jgi:ABC-type spermidine/putrescine transport system permease subunit II
MANVTEQGGRGHVRKSLSVILAYAGFVASFIAAVYWAYWIWELEWGGQTRVRALMFLAMVFGSIIVFFVGYFTSIYASDAIDRD